MSNSGDIASWTTYGRMTSGSCGPRCPSDGGPLPYRTRFKQSARFFAIRKFSRVRTWSRAPDAAASQAKGRLRSLERTAARLSEHVESWWDSDPGGEALYYVRESVGLSRLPFSVGGHSYATAHEAARALASVVAEAIMDAPGDDDICDDAVFDTITAIAIRLESVRFPDFAGQIEQEYHAARAGQLRLNAGGTEIADQHDTKHRQRLRIVF